MDIRELAEQQEKAQLIIDAAILRVREMGFGVVANGTVFGNGVWLDRIEVVPTQIEFKMLD